MFDIYKMTLELEKQSTDGGQLIRDTYESMGSCPHHPRDPCSQRTESPLAHHPGSHLMEWNYKVMINESIGNESN